MEVIKVIVVGIGFVFGIGMLSNEKKKISRYTVSYCLTLGIAVMFPVEATISQVLLFIFVVGATLVSAIFWWQDKPRNGNEIAE